MLKKSADALQKAAAAAGDLIEKQLCPLSVIGFIHILRDHILLY